MAVDVIDYCKVYFTDDPASAAPTATSAPSKIISGRVAVHQILMFAAGTSQSASPISNPFNNRPYYLAGSASSTDVYLEWVALPPSSPGFIRPFPYPMGGNGILFEDGVYLGKSANAPDGTSTAVDLSLTLSIFYTGGG